MGRALAEGVWREREAVVERWRGSGLALAEFARREGIAYGALLSWRNRFGAREHGDAVGEPASCAAPLFREVAVEADSRGASSPRGARAVLTIRASTRILVCRRAADMRRSIDGLAAMARSHAGEDPLEGHLFLFRNRRGDRLKALFWDGNGFCVLYKRLERGRFSFPPVGEGRVAIDETSLRLLLGKRLGIPMMSGA